MANRTKSDTRGEVTRTRAFDPQEAPLIKLMSGYSSKGVDAVWDGAPTGFTIRENFPVEALEEALRAFAKGATASIMTITRADPGTYQQAMRDQERYDLLRVRMRGWSEFFVTMFPAHQAQHQRRPFETASSTTERGAAHAR